MNDDDALVGTGTGKSFAYLVPGAAFASVVISTNTINLQLNNRECWKH